MNGVVSPRTSEVSAMPNISQDLSDDILAGLAAIGKFIGKTERQTKYLAERGYIPTFRIGKLVHARKSELDAHHRAKPAAA
jgi:hypothetical protein